MKKLAFILMAATVMVGCKKSEITEAPPLTSPGMMAKVGGTSIDYGTPTAEKQMSTSGSETVFIPVSTMTVTVLQFRSASREESLRVLMARQILL